MLGVMVSPVHKLTSEWSHSMNTVRGQEEEGKVGQHEADSRTHKLILLSNSWFCLLIHYGRLWPERGRSTEYIFIYIQCVELSIVR